MRTVKGDESTFTTDRWGEAESRVRDELLRRRDLLPGEYFELTRCRRFNPGDVVRTQTVELVHRIAREHKVRIAAKRRDSIEAANGRIKDSRCEQCKTRQAKEGRPLCSSCYGKQWREKKKQGGRAWTWRKRLN